MYNKIEDPQVHVHASFNNTIISLTDKNGNVIYNVSGGTVGAKGAKKSTTYISQQVCYKMISYLKENNINMVSLYINGVGSGRESILSALNISNISAKIIKDVTPLVHNGCKPPKRRRI